MSTIKPFRGYLPKPELVQKISCLPYDVLSVEEAREEAKQNELSFLYIDKPEINFPKNTDLKTVNIYQKAAERLQLLIKNKHLIQTQTPCFYLYRQQMGTHIQTGLVAGASLAEYQEGKIKRHEFTRPDKEIDRMNHIDITDINAGCIFLTYRHVKAMDALTQKETQKKPDIHFTSADGIIHTVWIIDNDTTIKEIETIFKNIPALYVADGHHRLASSARVQAQRAAKNPNHTGDEGYNYTLTVIFPDNEMKILDYNRVLKHLNGQTQQEILEKIKINFNINPIQASDPETAKPKSKHSMALYIDKNWYQLTAKSKIIPQDDPINSLDVAIVQNYILQPIFGIENPRTDMRIDFVGGIRGLKELVKRCNEDCVCALALYPTTIDDLLTVADAGEVMPPKSTWFEPKLRSGIIIRPLSN